MRGGLTRKGLFNSFAFFQLQNSVILQIQIFCTKTMPTEDPCFGSEVSIFKAAMKIWVYKLCSQSTRFSEVSSPNILIPSYYPSVLERKRAKRVKISHDIVQLVIAQYRARTHPVTLVDFFQVTDKG